MTSQFASSFGNRAQPLVGRGAEISAFVKGLEGAPGHPVA